MLAWSDPASQPSLDQIVTNISIYWFTGCYPSSIWFYRNVSILPGNEDFIDPRWVIDCRS